MADIPEEAKKLAAAAAASMKANFVEVPPGAVLPTAGFAADPDKHSNLPVEPPAALLPSAMDTDALAKARAAKTQEGMDANAARYAKQQSVWEEQVSKIPAKDVGEDKRDLDHDVDR